MSRIIEHLYQSVQPLRSHREDSKEADAEESRSFLRASDTPKASRGFSKAYVLASILNVAALLLTVFLVLGPFRGKPSLPLNAELRATASYSPVYDLVDLDPRPVTTNGTLFPPRHPSIARQLPNPAADALWEEWELTRVLPVSRADILRMGKDPATAAKLDDGDWGLGDDAYAAILDVYHHLHCLNSLRQIAYGAYYGNASASAAPLRPDRLGMREMHVNHCVDILMQALQCSGNVGLITMHWVETQHNPYPDMSVGRKCMDFERLTEWRKKSTVDMDKYAKVMKKPEGAKQLPAPDALYQIHGWENPNHVNGAHPGEDFNL